MESLYYSQDLLHTLSHTHTLSTLNSSSSSWRLLLLTPDKDSEEQGLKWRHWEVAYLEAGVWASTWAAAAAGTFCWGGTVGLLRVFSLSSSLCLSILGWRLRGRTAAAAATAPLLLPPPPPLPLACSATVSAPLTIIPPSHADPPSLPFLTPPPFFSNLPPLVSLFSPVHILLKLKRDTKKERSFNTELNNPSPTTGKKNLTHDGL